MSHHPGHRQQYSFRWLIFSRLEPCHIPAVQPLQSQRCASECVLSVENLSIFFAAVALTHARGSGISTQGTADGCCSLSAGQAFPVCCTVLQGLIMARGNT